MRLQISGRAIVGSKEPQQDAWRVFNARGENVSERAGSSTVATGDGALVIVADGIGGYAGGEVASRVACDAFASVFFSCDGADAERLALGLDAANVAIARGKQRSPDLQGMGCTLIAVYFQNDKMTFVSVGDSLLLRSREDEMHRVNVDHSYFDYLDRQVLGSSDPDRWSIAMGDKRRDSLTLAVTGTDLKAAEFGHGPQIATRPLLADDIIIVASDGIETLDMVQIQNFLKHSRAQGVAGVADSLIGAVDGIGKTRSYQDNTTIVVVGATSGAGLTRVSMGSQSAAPVPSVNPPAGASLLRRFSLPSNTQLRTGATLFAVVLLVISVLFFAFKGKPQSSSEAPSSIDAPVDQGGANQQGTTAGAPRQSSDDSAEGNPTPAKPTAEPRAN